MSGTHSQLFTSSLVSDLALANTPIIQIKAQLKYVPHTKTSIILHSTAKHLSLAFLSTMLSRLTSQAAPGSLAHTPP